MSASVPHTLRTLAQGLTKPVLLFYALPWLIVLLMLGTIAQRYIGLYASEKLFFGSFILWVGPVPLPGAYSVLTLIALGLAIKLVFESVWEKKQIGVILTHVSVLVLLVGGLVTAALREEGYIVLGEGESGHVISDYHERALVISKNDTTLMHVSQQLMHAGSMIADPALPFTLSILRYCYQCDIVPRRQAEVGLQEMAEKMDIVQKVSEKDEAQSGVVFAVKGTGHADGTYLAAQALSEQPNIALGKDRYGIKIMPAERTLPFDVRLLHFEKTEYPGTSIPHSYRSEVMVKDGTLEWPATIEMNQPLRYRGYTLYQSSFIDSDGKLFTVLAVVKNAGASFPYIAISLLCLGLLIHLGLMIRQKGVI